MSVLLYLNANTFVGEDGHKLAQEVRKATAKGVHIVMVHENDPEYDGCPFELCAHLSTR